MPNVTEITIVWGLGFGLGSILLGLGFGLGSILLGLSFGLELILSVAVHVTWPVYVTRRGRSGWLMAQRPFREQLILCSHDHRPMHSVARITHSA